MFLIAVYNPVIAKFVEDRWVSLPNMEEYHGPPLLNTEEDDGASQPNTEEDDGASLPNKQNIC